MPQIENREDDVKHLSDKLTLGRQRDKGKTGEPQPVIECSKEELDNLKKNVVFAAWVDKAQVQVR